MRAAVLIGSAALLALPTAATAQYYVAESSTHHCTITTTKPADREYVTQIGPIEFKSRAEAEDRMKQIKGCGDQPVEPRSTTTVIKKKLTR